jgi:hypothetical protein
MLHLRHNALRRVDFPMPFSPTKMVTGVLNSSEEVRWNISRLNGYSALVGNRFWSIIAFFRNIGKLLAAHFFLLLRQQLRH